MNITHAKDENVKGDKLVAIFDRQKYLMDKYHHIEAKSGLLQTEDCPINLDDKRGQARIKDFAWRVTEELGEALDALRENDLAHFQEELIDGLHFLTELSILADLTPSKIRLMLPDKEEWLQDRDLLDVIYYIAVKTPSINPEADFICALGMTCNCLKNKPWKQSQMRTDCETFFNRLFSAWVAYFRILSKTMSPEEIVNTYLKKSQVNMFRQRSNY